MMPRQVAKADSLKFFQFLSYGQMDSAKSPPKKLPRIASLPGAFSVAPPGSKSIANRVLPLAALSRNPVDLENLPDGEDVTLMRRALNQLGFSISDAGFSDTINGSDFFRARDRLVELFLGNSGTATRILTALLAAGEGTFRVTGVPRMYERPIGDLVDALLPLCGDTEIHYDGKAGYPPLTIHARGLAGGKTTIRGNLSSQFVTGILMAMPLCRNRVEVEIEGTLVSAPYVDLTLQVMKDFHAKVDRDGYKKFWIENPSGYDFPHGFYVVEPDASSASYFLAAAAITGTSVTVKGIRNDSAQGESRFARNVLEKMGASVDDNMENVSVATEDNDFASIDKVEVFGNGKLHGIDIDMDLMSDTGMTLAVLALFAEGKTTIRNVGNWRLKETDRLAAMATELRKLGATVEEGPDWISIDPPAKLNEGVVIDTYDDHRMAMCFSLVTLGPKGVAVTINDPDCVRKTYPGYWKEFARMTGSRDES
jgi:3-phosphoshikimate 1-carboxyvinyltransferase